MEGQEDSVEGRVGFVCLLHLSSLNRISRGCEGKEVASGDEQLGVGRELTVHGCRS